MPNVTIYGKTSGGDYKPLLVGTDGTLQTSGSGGGGGTTAISGTVPTTIQSGTVNVAGTVPVSVPGTVTTVSTLGGTTELKPYTAPLSGAVMCGTVATQLPNIACKLVRFKARTANSGTVFMGTSGVTAAGTVTDTTSGLPLVAGDDTGWIPIDNLNRLHIISGGSPNVITYLALN
jgi:hypothetical protein